MTDKQKYAILCVDDEIDILDSLSDTFMDDYIVKTALSGQEALRIFDEEDIFLVISDQRMPEMQGSELLAQINARNPMCKKILLTGYADITAAIDAINNGSVDKYLSKPWDDDELLRVVSHLQSLHKIDVFQKKMISDVKGLKERAKIAPLGSPHFEEFLDNYRIGVGIVDENSMIIHLNAGGREILNCSDPLMIKGKNYRDIFCLDDETLSAQTDAFEKGIFSFHTIDAKLFDQSKVSLKVGVVFKEKAEGPVVNGFIFDRSV